MITNLRRNKPSRPDKGLGELVRFNSRRFRAEEMNVVHYMID